MPHCCAGRCGAFTDAPGPFSPDRLLAGWTEYKKTYLWVELGFQTSNEQTADAMNRCYENVAFEKAMTQLSALEQKLSFTLFWPS